MIGEFEVALCEVDGSKHDNQEFVLSPFVQGRYEIGPYDTPCASTVLPQRECGPARDTCS